MTIYAKGERLAIVAAARTPQAKAFSELASFSAVELGVHAIQAAVERADMPLEAVDEVIMGNVVGPPDAANIARVISISAGVPQSKPAHTVNRNCASGMESILAAGQAIHERGAKYVLAGGAESMSGIPFLHQEAFKRKLLQVARCKSWFQKAKVLAQMRMRDLKPVNGIMLGLTDPTCGMSMGETAELLANDFAISRVEQDNYALKSHQRASAAAERCFLSGEIAPLQTSTGNIEKDVGPRPTQSMEQLAKLQPMFDRQGSITAGNSCPITDGAAAMLLSPERIAERPLGFVSGYTVVGCEPKRMGLGPVYATSQLLREARLRLDQLDLFEINEAFAAQVLACLCAFNSETFAREKLGVSTALGAIDFQQLNIHGGAIALGHPVGSSGTRIVMTLARALREKGLERGIATLCVGGGQGLAVLVETG